jgi:hypothetical protein
MRLPVRAPFSIAEWNHPWEGGGTNPLWPAREIFSKSAAAKMNCRSATLVAGDFEFFRFCQWRFLPNPYAMLHNNSAFFVGRAGAIINGRSLLYF